MFRGRGKRPPDVLRDGWHDGGFASSCHGVPTRRTRRRPIIEPKTVSLFHPWSQRSGASNSM